MIININRLVTVTLTDAGRDHFREHLSRVLSISGMSGAAKDRILRNETPGEDGKRTMPLWQVFDIFGDALNGPKTLIVGGNIEVSE